MSIVHFIGAGPGDPELITVRALKFIRTCPVILYAGSLIPTEILREAAADAQVIDSAPLHLDEIIHEIEKAVSEGKEVARLHSGDPSIYGATAEQMRRLVQKGIAYDVTPGVPAFAAAAAALKCELTLPEISQSILLSRTEGAASPMPSKEKLANLAAVGGTLILHLSIRNLRQVLRDVTPHHGEDCPIIVAYRVGWPDQVFIKGTLGDIATKVKETKITRTALLMIGRVFGEVSFPDSRLYDEAHHHILRPGKSRANQSTTSAVSVTKAPG